MAFTNSVLLVVTLVRPVPQFSSSGTLMTISAVGNATLGIRAISEEYDSLSERDPIEAEMKRMSTFTAAPVVNRNLHRRTPDHGEIEQEGWYIENSNKEEELTKGHASSERVKSFSKTSEADELYFLETPTTLTALDGSTRTHAATLTSSTLMSTSTLLEIPSATPDLKLKSEKIVKVAPKRRLNGWVEIWIGPLGVCIQRG